MIEHAQREREIYIYIYIYITFQSLQTVFAKQIPIKKNYHRVSWRMPLFLWGNTCQYFQHMGGIKARLKVEASSLLLLNLHSYSTQNLVDLH